MKRSKSKIWEKKRQRKFKIKKQVKATSPATNKQQPVKPINKEKAQKVSKKSLIDSYKSLGLRPRKNEKKKSEHVSSGNTFTKWLKHHDSDIQLILFPLILLVILIILTVFNN